MHKSFYYCVDDTFAWMIVSAVAILHCAECGFAECGTKILIWSERKHIIVFDLNHSCRSFDKEMIHLVVKCRYGKMRAMLLTYSLITAHKTTYSRLLQEPTEFR